MPLEGFIAIPARERERGSRRDGGILHHQGHREGCAALASGLVYWKEAWYPKERRGGSGLENEMYRTHSQFAPMTLSLARARGARIALLPNPCRTFPESMRWLGHSE